MYNLCEWCFCSSTRNIALSQACNAQLHLVSYTYVQIIACVALYNTKRRDFLSFFFLPFLCCDLLRGGPSFNIKDRKFESLSIPSKKKFSPFSLVWLWGEGWHITYRFFVHVRIYKGGSCYMVWEVFYIITRYIYIGLG